MTRFHITYQHRRHATVYLSRCDTITWGFCSLNLWHTTRSQKPQFLTLPGLTGLCGGYNYPGPNCSSPKKVLVQHDCLFVECIRCKHFCGGNTISPRWLWWWWMGRTLYNIGPPCLASLRRGAGKTGKLMKPNHLNQNLSLNIVKNLKQQAHQSHAHP